MTRAQRIQALPATRISAPSLDKRIPEVSVGDSPTCETGRLPDAAVGAALYIW